MQSLKLGNPVDDGTQMGPQADKAQTSNILSYLEIGSKDGKAIVGGAGAKDKGDNFIQPTIFTNLQDDSRLNVEEIFGPVQVLHEFKTEEEAVRRANDTECMVTYLMHLLPHHPCIASQKHTIRDEEIR
jgi:aldehyde dehydrogenase (NAD+)